MAKWLAPVIVLGVLAFVYTRFLNSHSHIHWIEIENLTSTEIRVEISGKLYDQVVPPGNRVRLPKEDWITSAEVVAREVDSDLVVSRVEYTEEEVERLMADDVIVFPIRSTERPKKNGRAGAK